MSSSASHSQTITSYRTFAPFSRLPEELRVIIWEFAMPRPNLIEVTGYGHRVPYASATRSNPGILFANKESRKVALKNHTMAFRSRLREGIYFNFASDALYLPMLGAFRAFLATSKDGIRYIRFPDSAQVEDKVRHLVVGNPSGAFFQHTQSWIGFFGNLETAVIEWNDSKQASHKAQRELEQYWARTKESERGFPVVHWLSSKDFKALVESWR
jgi:hypothetical protein